MRVHIDVDSFEYDQNIMHTWCGAHSTERFIFFRIRIANKSADYLIALVKVCELGHLGKVFANAIKSKLKNGTFVRHADEKFLRKTKAAQWMPTTIILIVEAAIVCVWYFSRLLNFGATGVIKLIG